MRKTILRCGKLRILAVLCPLVSTTTATQAEVVRGRVVDAETREALPNAQIRFVQQVDNGTWVSSLMTDSVGSFCFFARRRGNLEVSMLGYHPSKPKTVLAFSDSRRDTLDVGTIELKMSAQMLKMVEVTGRARRFSVRGDTIVFHPEAFHLQDGARLDELIRQLPGVEVDDKGALSWNGKPIRITMDGESLFGGDELVKQLPAEAVQNLKAYNRQSELSERTGKDDGTQDMVLDLTIKPGFLDRWYGDLKAGYQTADHYEGEVSLNRLSKKDPVMVFADANNINKNHRRNMNNSWSSMNRRFGQEQGVSAGYQHNWNRKEGSHDLKSYYSVTGGIVHDDNWRTEHQVTENYLPNTAATRSSSEDYKRNHVLEPRVSANLRWVRDTLNTFSLSASAEHQSKRSRSRQSMEQESAIGTAFMPTLSQQTSGHSEGRETKMNTEAKWEHYVKDGALGASVRLSYVDGHTEGQTERTITAHSEALASSQLTQAYTSPSTHFSTTVEAHHARWLAKAWMVQTQYSLTYNSDHSNRDFLTNGLADAANSYRNSYSQRAHSLQLAQTISLGAVQLMPRVVARWLMESQDYQRGVSSDSYRVGEGWGIDTAVVRHCFIVNPSLRATWKLCKTAGFELNYSYDTRQPAILQTVAFRDLTDPLFISEGNPGLRNTRTHDMKLAYDMVLARSQTSLGATIGFRSSDNETTSALSYDPATAVYVSRPENVRGSRSWNVRLNLDQGLGDLLRLQGNFSLSGAQSYGYLTLLPGQNGLTLNRQSTFTPREYLSLSLNESWLKATVFADISASRLRYTASSEYNTTQWNNSFGLQAEVSWGKFVFWSRLAEYTYRGYTISGMNRNVLRWDGSVSWKILKDKARLTLELDDILNTDDGRWSYQSAYQQTTYFSDFHHHYVGLSFTYHLDAKKK